MNTVNKIIRNAEYMRNLKSTYEEKINDQVESILDSVEQFALLGENVMTSVRKSISHKDKVVFRGAESKLVDLGFYFTDISLDIIDDVQIYKYTIHWK